MDCSATTVTIRLLLAILFISQQPTAATERCGDDHFRATSFGEVLLVIDGNMDFDQSKEYCQERNSVLATLNSMERIYEISDMLLECEYSDKRAFIRHSYEHSFRVGLKTKAGESKWEDGQAYSAITERRLFKYNEIPGWTGGHCETAYLSPYHKDLTSMYCSYENPFICWRRASTGQQTTTAQETTTEETTIARNRTKAQSDKICEIETSNSGLVIGLLSVTVAILLLLIVCLAIYQLLVAGKQRRDSKTENKAANNTTAAPSCSEVQNDTYVTPSTVPSTAAAAETSMYLQPDLNGYGDVTGHHYEVIDSPTKEPTYLTLDTTSPASVTSFVTYCVKEIMFFVTCILASSFTFLKTIK